MEQSERLLLSGHLDGRDSTGDVLSLRQSKINWMAADRCLLVVSTTLAHRLCQASLQKLASQLERTRRLFFGAQDSVTAVEYAGRERSTGQSLLFVRTTSASHVVASML